MIRKAEDSRMSCGISPPFGGLSPTSGQVAHVLLTRLPLYRSPEGDFLVRLACVRHAASVRSEPGSNSPVKVRIRRLAHARRRLATVEFESSALRSHGGTLELLRNAIALARLARSIQFSKNIERACRAHPGLGPCESGWMIADRRSRARGSSLLFFPRVPGGKLQPATARSGLILGGAP